MNTKTPIFHIQRRNGIAEQVNRRPDTFCLHASMGCGPSKEAAKAVSTEAPAPAPILTAAQLKKAEEDQKRIERIGVSAEPLPDFTPNASFVIKTKRTNTHQKVFINVYHHELVPVETRFVTRNEQWKVDRKGENVCVFTCVLPASTYVSILKDPTLQPPVRLLYTAFNSLESYNIKIIPLM